MQLSEFRDLLANDGFAATFQTMGQYRTELLRALDGLRAQADARPPLFYYRPVGEDGLYEGPVHANSVSGKLLRDANPDEWKPLYTHPEASAPGLIDQAIAICQEEGDEWDSDRVQASKNYAHACRDRIRAITRASAATVAEPSDWTTDECAATGQTCNYGPHGRHGEKQCKYCGAKPAAQQQAEPVGDERVEDYLQSIEALMRACVKNINNWSFPEYDQAHRAVNKLRALLAAQSDQRAGVAEDAARLDWLTDEQVDTIYMDDGRIIDVGGGKKPHDVRAAIDAKRIAAAPTQQQERSE